MKKYALIIVLALCTSLQVMAQSELTITGHVTDTKGEDIIGASVIVKDAKGLGTITDVMGQYSIKSKTPLTRWWLLVWAHRRSSL